MRDFWRSHDGLLGEFATRFTGSSDLYGGARRRPTASVNLITVARRVHAAPTWSPTTTSTTRPTARTTATAPTTTARGTAASRAPPTTPTILALRGRQQPGPAHHAAAVVRRPDARSAATSSAAPSRATTTPTARTTPITWFDWADVDERPAGVHPAADRPAAGPPGVPAHAGSWSASDAGELRWFTPGRHADDRGRLGATPAPAASRIYLDGADAPDRAADGSPLLDDDFLVLVNAWWEPLDFTLPPTRPGQVWQPEIDTFDPSAGRPTARRAPPTRSPSGPAPSSSSGVRQGVDVNGS